MWIEIENSAGLRLGSPIITASEWKAESPLDATGPFSFVMPASDPRSNLCQHKSIARAWVMRDGVTKEVGCGIIDQIEVDPQSNGPALLRISGFDLLRELTYVTVGQLELFDRNSYLPDLIQLVNTGGPSYDIQPPFTIDLIPAPVSYLYIYKHETFDKVTFTITGPNYEPCSLKAQYYNEAGSWDTLTITDGTFASGATLNQSGAITFDMPSNWGYLPTTSYYIVRFYNDEADINAVDIADIQIELKEPTADGLTKIMALAPPAWSLDLDGGDLQTSQKVYLQMANETILAALVRLTEATGDHFAKSFSGRRVCWLRKDRQNNSGLRAIAFSSQYGEGMANTTLPIVSLKRTSDSYPLYTRVYPFGAGTASKRLTLASATDAAPSGYTLSTANNYLERDNALASYGRIDSLEEFPYIAPLDRSISAEVLAANALLQAACERLSRFTEIQYAYQLTVLPGFYAIYPGQTLYVEYHEWKDEYHSIDIRSDLWVLSRTESIDQTGLMIITLTVATIDRAPQNDKSLLIDILRNGEMGRWYTNPRP